MKCNKDFPDIVELLYKTLRPPEAELAQNVSNEAAEAVFRRLACPSNRSHRGRCVASGDLRAAVGRNGSVAAMPSGGSTSPLEEHAEFLLRPIVEQPGLTNVGRNQKKRIPGSRTVVWRFFERRNISFKKILYAAEQKRAKRPCAPAVDAAAKHV